MKKLIIIFGLLWGPLVLFAQKYMGRAMQVTFEASTPLEDIDPVNNEAACILDAAAGDVIMEVLIHNFKFDKALMQEHFNENYLESDQYPKALFKGKIQNIKQMDFTRNGDYDMELKGSITIHGVTRPLDLPGKLRVSGETLKVEARFQVRPEDFDINIPAIVRNKIAKLVRVEIRGQLQKR